MVTLDEYIEYTRNNFLPKDAIQEKTGTGDRVWTADDWTLAVAECWKAGIDNYKPDNPFYWEWRNHIFQDTRVKIKTQETLSEIKDAADSLLICEVGRGLDILVARLVKEWKTIYCYDQIDYKKYLFDCFGYVDFIQDKSAIYDLSLLKEECIMIFNSTKMGEHMRGRFFDCKKIIHVIQNGELLK